MYHKGLQYLGVNMILPIGYSLHMKLSYRKMLAFDSDAVYAPSHVLLGAIKRVFQNKWAASVDGLETGQLLVFKRLFARRFIYLIMKMFW